MAHITVIGSGFSGLAAACMAAREGHRVEVLEKNETVGGRARMFRAEGFTFDMGPSWYWMPDVFDDFFAAFGRSTADYYDLVKLDPGFQIIFGPGDVLQVPADREALYALFDDIEPGSAGRLQQFLKEAGFKYEVAMKELVYRPAFSWLEFANARVLKGMAGAHLFSSVSSYVRRYFRDERLIALLEFPVLFLGAMPDRIPALYTLMNYAALEQGTYYPMGGMYRISAALTDLATELGVQIHTSTPAERLLHAGRRVTGVRTSGGVLETDGVIAAADYHHVEQQLLDPELRNYSPRYWAQRTMAPSCLIFYIGVNGRIPGLQHHNLYFDTDFNRHAEAIYKEPAWPESPLFYACCPSRTDPSVAPEGMENLFLLVPVASGITDAEALRSHYLDLLLDRISRHTGFPVRDKLVFTRSYCVQDFERDYNAYKGNAYGLANTLRQTAVLKPSLRNRKLDNLFYAGQLTVPGPGVPPALISGRIAAAQLIKRLKTQHHEALI